MKHPALWQMAPLAAGLLLNASGLAQHTIVVNGNIEDGPGFPLMVRMVMLDAVFPLVPMADSVLSTAEGAFNFNVTSPWNSTLVVIFNACQPSFGGGAINIMANSDTTVNATMPCLSSFPCFLEYVVFPALDGDQEPIPFAGAVQPYVVGGLPPFTYSWDFGDGSTSTEAEPSHTYGGNGPYELCLTITDGVDCNSTFCDTLTVDDDGTIWRNGFTITGLPIEEMQVGLAESAPMGGKLSIAPNPGSGARQLLGGGIPEGRYRLLLWDQAGRVIYEDALQLGGTNATPWYTPPTLPPGSYTLVIMGRDHTLHARMMVD